MTLKKFKSKIKRKSEEELIIILATLNRDYYLSLRYMYANPFPPHPEEDRKYINILERKIVYVNTIIQQHLSQQNTLN